MMRTSTIINAFLAAIGAGLLLQVEAGSTANLEGIYSKAGVSHDSAYLHRNADDDKTGRKAINVIFRGPGHDREVFMAQGAKEGKGLKLPRGTPKQGEPTDSTHARETFEESEYCWSAT